MIPPNGTYWSTGITVYWRQVASKTGDESWRSGWGAVLDFYDGGFCSDNPDQGEVSTEGRLSVGAAVPDNAVTRQLRTRYAVADGGSVLGLRAAIDVLVADAQRMGIEFRRPNLYYKGDGTWDDFPAPDGWRELLTAEADRLGWNSPYRKRS